MQNYINDIIQYLYRTLNINYLFSNRCNKYEYVYQPNDDDEEIIFR